MGIGGDSGIPAHGGPSPARRGDGTGMGTGRGVGAGLGTGLSAESSAGSGAGLATSGTESAAGSAAGSAPAAPMAGGGRVGSAGSSARTAGATGTLGAPASTRAGKKAAATGTSAGAGATSGVVTARLAGGSTRETARPLPVPSRVRGGTVAATEPRGEPAVTVPAGALGAAPRPSGRDGEPEGTRAAGAELVGDGEPPTALSAATGAATGAVSDSVSSAAGDVDAVSGGGDEATRIAGSRPGHAVAAAPAGVSRPGVSRPGVSRAGADGLGLLQMLLPAAAQALGLAEQLARAAGEASTDAGDLKYQADILRDVLTGRVTDAERIPMAGLGVLLQRTVVVVVAEPDPGAGGDAAALRRQQDALTAAWTATVRQADPDAVVAGYAGEIVALLTAVPGQSGAGAAREAAGRVRTACARIPRTFSTGISRPVRGLAGLPEAYDQARRAVAAGRRLQGPGAVTDFDRLGVFRLLSLLPPDGELERFADEVLGALARPLDAEAADLRRTLQVLLETNLNVAETSRRLYVHYNTLRYRIGKLERLVGPFTQDSRLRLDLLIALEIVHLAEGVVARGE